MLIDKIRLCGQSARLNSLLVSTGFGQIECAEVLWLQIIRQRLRRVNCLLAHPGYLISGQLHGILTPAKRTLGYLGQLRFVNRAFGQKNRLLIA